MAILLKRDTKKKKHSSNKSRRRRERKGIAIIKPVVDEQRTVEKMVGQATTHLSTSVRPPGRQHHQPSTERVMRRLMVVFGAKDGNPLSAAPATQKSHLLSKRAKTPDTKQREKKGQNQRKKKYKTKTLTSLPIKKTKQKKEGERDKKPQ